MTIYLYCILRATREPPADLLGIDSSPVRAVDLGGLAAWVSDLDETSIVASPARARGHDRVVRAALEDETPLPARFGQVLPNEADFRAALSERRGALEAALERVEGAMEMTVRMLVPVAPGAESAEKANVGRRGPKSGRGYLEQVAAVQREERNVLAKARIVRDRVSSAVGRLVRAESFAGAASGSSLATLSHLVPRKNIDAYRNALLALRDEDPSLAIMVSGPWAPYSFTEGMGA